MQADPTKKTLIIVESPTKAKTIKKYLPSSCTVMASKGHIVDLAPNPKKGKHGVMVDEGYELEYEMTGEKKSLLSEMKAELRKADQLVLASDEDREGESISWHLYNYLKPKCPVYRMVFHEITKKAITSAFDNCRDIDMNLVHAQEARRVIDRLQGYEISPILAKKIGMTNASSGRVQSPGLKLLVDREKERRAFIRNDYTSVTCFFDDFKARLEGIGDRTVATKNSFDGKGGVKKNHVVLSDTDAQRIAGELRGADAKVESIVTQEKKQYPAVPFTTSTLQQDASRKMRISVKEVMSIAQKLYENGYITYMRTDSPTLSTECIRASRSQIGKLFGEGYLSASPRNYKAKSSGAQEAHEAIRPAGDTFRTPRETGLTGNELKLYTIVWKRTLATQMAEALKSATTVKLSSGDYRLTASGTTVLFDGFLKLYSESVDELSANDRSEAEDTAVLPVLKEGEERKITDTALESHTTEPSQRFNEATLVKMLEEKGIGRPSTYAQIISTILGKNYAIKQKNALVPTFTGFFVTEFLDSAFPLYVGYNFTSGMEEGLDEIARGETDKGTYLDKFWKGDGDFRGLSNDVDDVRRQVRISDSKTLSIDGLKNEIELDGVKWTYLIKNGKYGPYLSFENGNEGEGKMVSIDQTKYFPGSFTDEDALEIFRRDGEERVIEGTDISIRSGRLGEYFYRASDEKKISVPGKRKAESIGVDEINFMFSLPKTLGEDENGPAELRIGPYGYYVAYNKSNTGVAKDPETLDFAGFKKLYEAKNGPKEKVVLKDWGLFEEKPLELLDGRYGAYIKWGDKNCALSKDEKADPTSITPERAREIALAAPEKKKKFVRKKK